MVVVLPTPLTPMMSTNGRLCCQASARSPSPIMSAMISLDQRRLHLARRRSRRSLLDSRSRRLVDGSPAVAPTPTSAHDEQSPPARRTAPHQSLINAIEQIASTLRAIDVARSSWRAPRPVSRKNPILSLPVLSYSISSLPSISPTFSSSSLETPSLLHRHSIDARRPPPWSRGGA